MYSAGIWRCATVRPDRRCRSHRRRYPSGAHSRWCWWLYRRSSIASTSTRRAGLVAILAFIDGDDLRDQQLPPFRACALPTGHLADKIERAAVHRLRQLPFTSRTFLPTRCCFSPSSTRSIRYSIEKRRRQTALEQEFKNARELQQVLVPESLPAVPASPSPAPTARPRRSAATSSRSFRSTADRRSSSSATSAAKDSKPPWPSRSSWAPCALLAEFTTQPAEILAGLNRRLYGRMQGGFATCLAMRLDADGSCTIASAGHPAPFLNDARADSARRAAAGRRAHRQLRRNLLQPPRPATTSPSIPTACSKPAATPANSTASIASRPSSPPGPTPRRPPKPPSLRPGRRHHRPHPHPPDNRRRAAAPMAAGCLSALAAQRPSRTCRRHSAPSRRCGLASHPHVI